jgi:hypothetical protein
MRIIRNELDSRWETFFNAKVNGHAVFEYSKSNELADIDRPFGKGAPWWLNNDYYGIGNGYLNYLKTQYSDNNYFSASEVKNILNAIKNKIKTLVMAAFTVSESDAVKTNTYKLFSSQVPSDSELTAILTVNGLVGAWIAAQYGILGLIAGTLYVNGTTVSQICKLDDYKQYEIKEAFIKDYLKYCVEGAQVDDGAHQHTGVAQTNGSHKHMLDLDILRSYLDHTHPDSSIPSSTELNTTISGNRISGTNANLPPYLVCNIWQRMPNDWTETPTTGGGVTTTPSIGGGSIGGNPGVLV